MVDSHEEAVSDYSFSRLIREASVPSCAKAGVAHVADGKGANLLKRTIIITALTIAGQLPAHAKDWPTTGGWDIGETDNGCGMSMEYEGEGDTRVIFLKRTDGGAGMAVDNYGWSAKPDQKYELTFWLDREAYTGPAMGTASSGRKGFVATFGADFARDFARASSFRIYLGDTLVDHLSLDGTAAALAVVDRCVAGVARRLAAEAREKAKLAHIPKDPFASAPVTPGAAQNASPRGASRSWVTDDDYPPAALRSGAAGTVGYRLDIGADGRVTNCTVTASSGNSLLDDATCSLIKRRARFEPARDDAGNVVAATFSDRFTWRIPQ